MAVADKLLRSTFNFGATNIPVYSNGVCVYTPAVQRLLQLSANVYDADNTNFFPSVFRPLFALDNSNNVFIVGYQQVTNVSGVNDPQLATPCDLTALTNFPTIGAIITNANGPVNVYGVPWIIGAKKGFPNFNKFGMQEIIQIWRRLQVQRNAPVSAGLSVNNFIITNQLYEFTISNTLGIDCWNSYTNPYPNPVFINVQDTISMWITNSYFPSTPSYFPSTPLTANLVVPSWPGYVPGGSSTNSFAIPLEQKLVLLTNSIFYFGSSPPGVSGFWPESYNYGWETNRSTFDLPQFGLLTTNQLQLYMLDMGSSGDGPYHVIDYVQLAGPENGINLNAAFQTNSAVQTYDNMWATNAYTSGIPYGIMNQLQVSFGEIPLNSTYWANQPGGGVSASTAQAEIDGFCTFMGIASPYPGLSAGTPIGEYYTNNAVVQVPYTPVVTISDYTTYQANDPLVHYLASDLNYSGTENGNTLRTGIIVYSQNQTDIVVPSYTSVNTRYQPWGAKSTSPTGVSPYNTSGYDTNVFNLSYRDPLVWQSDDWNFPTNENSLLSELGQIHRGTPWQTLYLKADNILHNTTFGPSTGTNTWGFWTGDTNTSDADIMAPVSDRQLASLLVALLNTNDITRLMSVNDPNVSDWLNILNGMTVYSNSIGLSPFIHFTGVPPPVPPTFDMYVMPGNSPQAALIASNIVQSRTYEPNNNYNSIGDIMTAPELTETSPWLNVTNVNDQTYGINDAAYEAIPNQLLFLLRPDSIGTLVATNGGWSMQFSGSDAYVYALQTSTNLVNWQTVSTNCPVQGQFSVALPEASGPAQYYRTILLP